MNSSEEKTRADSEATQDAAAKIAVLIAQLGGVIVGLVAVAYLIGYHYLRSYYSDLGIPRALALYSSDQVPRAGFSIVTLVVVVALITIAGLLDGKSDAKKIAKRNVRVCIVLIIVNVFALVTPSAYFPAKYSSVTLFLSSLGLAISAGLTIGQLIGSLATTGCKWKGEHLWLLYSIYLFAGYTAPDSLASSIAGTDMSVDNSALPYVSKEGISDEPWRLVAPIGDKFLLVRLSKDASDRTFKVVAIGDAWRITEARR